MDTNHYDNSHVDDIDMLAAPAPDDLSLGLDLANELPPPVPNPEPPALAEEAPPPIVNDIDRMLCHEDFPALLAKATKVKSMREAMDLDTAPSAGTESTLDPTHIINAVTRMQEALASKGANMPIVRKGTYPLTDSMLEESFEVLQKELERCEEWYQERKLAAGGRKAAKRGTDGEVIAVKYAKWQTDILMDWMIEHKEHPFPDADEIKELGEKTSLTHSQIVNWTTNVRKRNLKATVEGGKKPHHFIDFVFLAHDRERREAQGLDPAPPLVKKAATRRKKKKAPAKAKQSDPVPTMQYAGAFRPYPGGPVYYAAPPPHHHHHHSMQQHQQPPPGGYHPYGMQSQHQYQQHNDGYHPYSMQQQHQQKQHHQSAPNGYHSHYQHPFPPPPHYAYHHQSSYAAPAPAPHHAANNGWDGYNLGVVSESFDDSGSVNPPAMEEEQQAVASFGGNGVNPPSMGVEQQQNPNTLASFGHGSGVNPPTMTTSMGVEQQNPGTFASYANGSGVNPPTMTTSMGVEQQNPGTFGSSANGSGVNPPTMTTSMGVEQQNPGTFGSSANGSGVNPPTMTTSMGVEQQQNPGHGTIASSTDSWKIGHEIQQQQSPQTNDRVFDQLNAEAKSLISTQQDTMAVAVGNNLMAGSMEPTPPRGGSLSSVELMSLNGSHSFLDDYQFAEI